MPSKLRKAIGAVKDQTSISLAKVSPTANSSSLGIAILKATTHDEVPMDDRYVCEVLELVAASKNNAAACAHAVGKRISRTRKWIVALKSLMLVLRIFQDGDPFFPREVLYAMKRGAKILNLSNFRDDSNSSPWDYTAFVRTFALYLDERLDCFLMGKLQRRFVAYTRGRPDDHRNSRRAKEPVRDIKPAILLEKITYWQRLLDRAIATQPTGAARSNRLVQISLYAIVQESFDLYRDISDGLALLLDSFFHLQYQSCVNAFQNCVKASNQFEQLCAFYDLCKSIGVGRTSEYPSVQKISHELIDTLCEFLKDQASFPTNGKLPTPNLFLPAATPGPQGSSRSVGSCSDLGEGNDPEAMSEPTERFSDKESGSSSRCPSSDDLISTAETEATAADDEESVCSVFDQRTSSSVDLASLDDPRPQQIRKTEEEEQKEQAEQEHQEEEREPETSGAGGWELVLFETTTKSAPITTASAVDNAGHSFCASFDDQNALHHTNPFNPFLQDEMASGAAGAFSMASTFQAAPTFSASSPEETTTGFRAQENDLFAAPTFSASSPETTTFQGQENDPFAPCAAASTVGAHDPKGEEGSSDQQNNLLQEQQLWLQHQNAIIGKRCS
ncbi:clathrin coat assembly protein AP180 [Malania oleifera]|uniref:clathrin coat assembly protein AP180 n=1 Tax=Malania oleifera TaxID=397392 RepID=UPI0025AEB8D5|nr:clathrin coat assembly protein AP180 [Malania oleifera]